ncbi:MAG: hypothetical protein AMJ79_05030, partial [Phycisphaerae bacterium SM23_30]
MKQIWRQTFHAIMKIVMVVVWFIFLGTNFIDYIIFKGVSLASAFYQIRMLIILFSCGVYGFFRVRSFHPIFNHGYLQWLALSPWRFGKPLPLGPVHLVWVDLAVVGTLTLLMYSVDVFYVELPAITFL